MGVRQFRELPPVTVARSRTLRTHMTDAERKLWKHLRNKQLNGWRFRRQHPIGNYIADFACIECKLVIELDGGQHATQQSYDAIRDQHIKEQGFTILRFWNHDVMKNIDGVIQTILESLEQTSPPS